MTPPRLAPVFALLERSLRVDSRSWQWTAARAALPLVVLVAMFPMQTLFRIGTVGAPGLMFFKSMVWTTFALLTVSGLSFFSAAIAEEKEEMTLGLLRMTGLSPVSILFGKSTARLAGALLLLAVTLPFTLLAVTLGGVGTDQVLATYITLAAYLFFLANVALLCSVISSRPAHATALTALLLMLFYLVPTLLEGLLPIWRPKAPAPWLPAALEAARFASRLLPTSELVLILQTGFSGPLAGQATLGMVMGGAGFFLLAWALFERGTREQREAAPSRPALFRRGSRRGRVPPHIRGSPAVTWRDYTFMGGGSVGAAFRFLLAGGVATAVACLPRMMGEKTTPPEFVSACFFFIPVGVAFLGMSLDAGRMFNQEWQWKTLSGLATLPVPLPELVWRKVQASLKQAFPVLLLLLVSLLYAPGAWGDAIEGIGDELGGVLLIMAMQYLVFLSLTAFLSLVLKRGAFAASVAILYFGMGFMMMPLGFLLSAFGVRDSASFFALILIPSATAIGTLWFGTLRRLEHLAAEG